MIWLVVAVNACCAGDPKLPSFEYEEGQPSVQPYMARPLAGQDGWEDRGGFSAQPVVTNHLSETGQQVVYREVAGGRSSLRRRMTVENSGGPIRISASFYYTPKELPNESGWPHTVFLMPCGDDGERILEFGIDTMNGPPRLYAFVPLEGVPDHLLTVPNPQPLQEGWYWMEVLLDQGNRKILSVQAACVEPGLAPAQSRKVLPILAEPLPYGRDSKSRGGEVHYLNLAMGDNSAVDDIHFGSQEINFEKPTYSAQGSVMEGPLRSHKVRLAPAKGTVYVYGTFGMVEANPLDQLKGLQTIMLGEAKGETFTPVARFGLANDKGRVGSRILIVP